MDRPRVLDSELAQFDALAAKLITQKSISSGKKIWLADYISASPVLRNLREKVSTVAEQANPPARSNRSAGTTEFFDLAAERARQQREHAAAYAELNPPATTCKPARELPSLRLDNMIIKPEKFDGVKPPPRRWFDDYERSKRLG